MSRNKKRQSAPRGSHYSEGNLVHDKTNQKLFFHTHVCTVHRETLADTASFDKAEGLKIMEKHLKKRQAHGEASILEDRFTIEKSKNSGKTPFRNWLFYKEIFDIHTSSTNPKYFLLHVSAVASGRRYYEVYKCKTKEDAAKFTGFIEKARANPNFEISDGSPLDIVAVPDPNRARSMANIEFQVSIDSGEETERPESIFHTISPTPPSGFEYDDSFLGEINGNQIQAIEEHDVRSVPMKQVEVLAHSAPPFSPTETEPLVGNGTIDLENVTYINFNPKRGAYACTNGPVYLYASREENIHFTESNDGSLNGHY